jgi:hypothetical protein
MGSLKIQGSTGAGQGISGGAVPTDRLFFMPIAKPPIFSLRDGRLRGNSLRKAAFYDVPLRLQKSVNDNDQRKRPQTGLWQKGVV